METKQTPEFARWLRRLRDQIAKRQILIRIARLEAGLMGDVRSVGNQVSELRIHTGPGYRVYFTRRGEEVILLLCGGDKGSQDRDISRAKDMAAQLE